MTGFYSSPANQGDLSGYAALPKVAATVSASGAAVVNKHNPVDATGATRAISLPTGQTEGTQVSVEKVDSSTNPVNVTGNLRGVAAATLALVWQFESIMFRADSAGSWWPVAGHKTKTSLDNAYAALKVYPRDVVAPLDIPSPDGTNRATHPSIVRAPNGTWKGHRYWMAYTPYPTVTVENPCILVSENGVDWEVPTGLTNPIRSYAYATSRNFVSNSDTELLLVNNQLHLYWRMYDDRGGSLKESLYRVVSDDGITWTGDTEVLTTTSNLQIMSQSITLESGSNMNMWVVDGRTNTDRKVVRYTSADLGLSWTGATNVTLPSGHNPWHIAVQKVNGVYYMLSVDNTPGTGGIVLLSSTDGLTWTGDTGYVFPKSGQAWDANYFYRSWLLPAPGGKWDLWISAVDNAVAKYTIGFYPGFDWNAAVAEARRQRSVAVLTLLDMCPVVDGFERQSHFGIGVPDKGPAWNITGVVSSSVRIGSGLLNLGVGGAGTGQQVYVDGGSANGEAVADVIPATSMDVGLLLRRIDASNFLYLSLSYVSGTSDQIRIRKYDAGVLSTLATYTPAGFVPNKRYRIGFKADGTAFTVTLNGAVVLTYTLGTSDQTKFGAATGVGFWGWADNLTAFDNYSYRKLA